jgi:hypothetical protein
MSDIACKVSDPLHASVVELVDTPDSSPGA